MITALLLISAAHADHWWGIGPTIGTMGFPVEYPALMPALAQNTKGANLVDPVLFDLRAGAHAVYYTGKGGGRVGARAWFAGNFADFGSQEFTVEYEWLLTKDDNFQVLAGGGLGFGHDHFGAAEPAKGTDPYLDVTYFPLRAQVGVLWRDRTRAYEANLFGTWHIAGDQRFSPTGDVADEETGTAVSDPFAAEGADSPKSDAALYVAVGAEITVYFGNFRDKGGGKNDDKHASKHKDDGKKSKKKKD